jgi:hypothetical protein
MPLIIDNDLAYKSLLSESDAHRAGRARTDLGDLCEFQTGYVPRLSAWPTTYEYADDGSGVTVFTQRRNIPNP